MLLEIDLLTLSMDVGLKLPHLINPIYDGLERSCQRDFINVSPVDVGLV